MTRSAGFDFAAVTDAALVKTDSSGSYCDDNADLATVNDGLKLTVHTDFAKHFGEAFKHGYVRVVVAVVDDRHCPTSSLSPSLRYLLKRGGFRKNWYGGRRPRPAMATAGGVIG